MFIAIYFAPVFFAPVYFAELGGIDTRVSPGRARATVTGRQHSAKAEVTQ
jgi:hypothetical protein